MWSFATGVGATVSRRCLRDLHRPRLPPAGVLVAAALARHSPRTRRSLISASPAKCDGHSPAGGRLLLSPEARPVVVGPLSDGRLPGHAHLDCRLSRKQPNREPIADLLATPSASSRLATSAPARTGERCRAQRRHTLRHFASIGDRHRLGCFLSPRVARQSGCPGGHSTVSSTITCTGSTSARTRMSRGTSSMIWRARHAHALAKHVARSIDHLHRCSIHLCLPNLNVRTAATSPDMPLPPSPATSLAPRAAGGPGLSESRQARESGLRVREFDDLLEEAPQLLPDPHAEPQGSSMELCTPPLRVRS